MRQIGIRDVLILVALVAFHFAITKLFVNLHEYNIIAFALAIPLPLTALVQLRLKITWFAASLLHYPLAIAWAFCFGVTYSMYWNSIPHDWFEHDSVGMTVPIKFGALLKQWAL